MIFHVLCLRFYIFWKTSFERLSNLCMDLGCFFCKKDPLIANKNAPQAVILKDSCTWRDPTLRFNGFQTATIFRKIFNIRIKPTTIWTQFDDIYCVKKTNMADGSQQLEMAKERHTRVRLFWEIKSLLWICWRWFFCRLYHRIHHHLGKL